MPAVLATMAETARAPIYDAHIVGVETPIRIGEAVNPSHYWKGWHTTNTIGAMAPPPRHRACSSSILWPPEKALFSDQHDRRLLANSARWQSHARRPGGQNGVLAASLARSGMTGIPPHLTGR